MPRTEEKYIVALDIGTSKVCVLVGEVTDRGQIEIIGKGTSPMKGTRRGNIINLDQAIEAVKKAVDEAEVSGVSISSDRAGLLGAVHQLVDRTGEPVVDLLHLRRIVDAHQHLAQSSVSRLHGQGCFQKTDETFPRIVDQQKQFEADCPLQRVDVTLLAIAERHHAAPCDDRPG